MASPCEVLIDGDDEADASACLARAESEAHRIEQKYSRYRDDSVVSQLQAAAGGRVEVDDETALLLDFADQCHRLSEGRFDVTSGVLRRLWRFDGSDRLPNRRDVEALLPSIGWRKVEWRRPWVRLPAGMEIDLGGIGKEYAVDRVCGLLGEISEAPRLVNFGGDLRASGPRRRDRPWQVGLEQPGADDRPAVAIDLLRGALATSGDSRRFLSRDGIRYSHILDPTTGWPVIDAPRSVTVLADSCLEAGMLATFAMLHGREAEAYLDREDVRSWCIRD